MKLSVTLFVALAALASPEALSAQGSKQSRGGNSKTEIPEKERPPAGMCRIWLEDVPAAQQPAPTDCATAVRNRPAKGKVIFGDDYAKKKGSDSAKGKLPIKGFQPPKPPTRRP
jgi:hypothetical protein